MIGDDRGAQRIDAAGKKRTISGDCESTQGLALSPTGGRNLVHVRAKRAVAQYRRLDG